ncbi:flagellar biosynthesis protein FlhA [Gracilinema caldarium]|uniref:Flagellar biosynthesis protein FlhA n=1 Tax=Gracilinema caldarium (strain ATCC 51460 / DSM 7334 / H1) TaxID=744872 RepID=F8EZ77_GRAC1|nr:flagellar biosynthesis protein FlhA [Gracilinema caldarium]AEJ19669.1 flagellar biosynthesis protein FlhA [Gracilinema caldarium DSM 7334]
MSDARRILSDSFLKDRSDLFVAIGVVAVVMMLIIPLPTVLLDALMALNLVLALLILLIVLYTKRPTDFSIFPTILLVSTVFGLAINVSSTRLILSQGARFDGKMIKAFSSFVVGSGGTEGLVIGFVIFIVIIAVQAIVITKGATRVAEVAARFALDALPGKQMAIEAEYNSGAITEEEAFRRKNELQREVDFYGAMDGASKFVSGNVKVGIFITVINVLGGIIIGVSLHGENIIAALGTYTTFSIGDGLLSQFPALLVSTATGIIVTRSISDGTFGSDVTSQFSRDARIYWIGAFVLAALSLMPGFPWYVLIPLALVLGFTAYRLGQGKLKQQEAEKTKTAAAKKPADESAEMSPVVPLDPLSLELGYGLIPLVDRDKGAELLERVHRIRRESALDLGLVIPRIRIIDNMRLEPSEYCFKIKGVDVGRGKIRMGYFLCINPGGVTDEIPGEKTKDPAFGLPALWISEDRREEAERAGYTVVDPPSIIATHLTEIIKRHAAEILGRQETQGILETLKKEYPAVVEEAQKLLSLGEIQKVLQALLREQVSIRNMVAILEALADFAPVTKDTQFLTEKARQALARQICLQYADDERTLRVLTIEQSLEQKIIDSRVETSSGVVAALEPALQRAWIKALSRSVAAMQEQGMIPLVLCSEAGRPLVKSSTEREIPDLVVLSVPEIVADITVEAVGEIRIE